ncbi:hypothetical protein EDB85DRAFT_1894911 [Lactarius pseudohatsudake]|nr:hypothetical protein EDB85DRAFT_1894911 [Lactarius pseudohatsudake]
MTTVAYQSLPSPANLSTMGPADTQPSRFLVQGFTNLKDSFFSGMQTRGYPAAEEYVNTCRIKIVNNRLFLPIKRWPRTRLQASVDTWLDTNKRPSSNSTASTTQRDEVQL